MSPPHTLQPADYGFVLQNLRVPDLQYKVLPEEHTSQLRAEIISRLAVVSEQPSSLVRFIDEHLIARAMPAPLINAVFLVDRCYEIWLKKSSLDNELHSALMAWRPALLESLWGGNGLELLGLLDFTADKLIGWCENPSRAKHVVPKMLLDVGALLIAEGATQTSIDQALDDLRSYFNKSAANAEKVAFRLLNKEFQQVRTDYGDSVATSFINNVFSGRESSSNAYRFIHDFWYQAVRRHVQRRQDCTIESAIINLTKRFRAVFVEAGQAAQKYSADLLEEMEVVCVAQDVTVPLEHWNMLTEEMIALLKGEPRSVELFTVLKSHTSPTQFQSNNKPILQEGEWLKDANTGFRLQLYQYFDDYGHYLFVNHLGMKMGLFNEQDLKVEMSARSLEKVAAGPRVSDVFKATVAGLEQIATKQRHRRREAAEKARLEAEKLQVAQQEAAELAQKKAEEIQLRSQQLQDKQKAAQRDERHSQILEVVSALKLGAWISIHEDGQLSRYKLAVKFAASGRYIFTDKYGIKKVEIKEDILIRRICDQEIEILNNGADFDASLERVIGRIRIAQ